MTQRKVKGKMLGASLVATVLLIAVGAKTLWAYANRSPLEEFALETMDVFLAMEAEIQEVLNSDTFVSVDDERDFLLAFAKENLEYRIKEYVALHLQNTDFVNIDDPFVDWDGGSWRHRIVSYEQVREWEIEAASFDIDEHIANLVLEEFPKMIPDTFSYSVKSTVDATVYHNVRFSFRIPRHLLPLDILLTQELRNHMNGLHEADPSKTYTRMFFENEGEWIVIPLPLP